MEVKAKAKFLRTSPRKLRLVADVIRGQNVNDAFNQLGNINKLATTFITKLLNSAVANAVNNFDLDKNNLFIKAITIDGGPTLDRWMPRARGRATPIRKRTSHISIVLAEVKESGKKEAKKQKIEAPVRMDRKPKEDEGVKVEDKKEKKEGKQAEDKKEKGKEIVDQHMESKVKHAKIEGKSNKGFVNKIFRRKSG